MNWIKRVLSGAEQSRAEQSRAGSQDLSGFGVVASNLSGAVAKHLKIVFSLTQRDTWSRTGQRQGRDRGRGRGEAG